MGDSKQLKGVLRLLGVKILDTEANSVNAAVFCALLDAVANNYRFAGAAALGVKEIGFSAALAIYALPCTQVVATGNRTGAPLLGINKEPVGTGCTLLCLSEAL